ncbi:MAG: DNA polymerase III subunit chi [Pseudomonadota bacterium]
MAEVRFYHLTERPLEAVLPVMLERSLARGWRVVVRGAEAMRISALDTYLWTYRDESFLPHGAEGSGTGADQPVWLTTAGDMPNDPQALMLIDGAQAPDQDIKAMEMTAILFDGLDPGAVAHARTQWRQVTQAGIRAVYWAQENGSWVRKSESG